MTIGNIAPSGATPSAAPGAPNTAALHKAASQFEALFVAQMLRSVRESAQTGSDESSSAMRDIADEQFAQALAEGGGLGLARTIEASFQPAARPPANQS
jgi:Rod binding domain-containing protein